MLGKSVDTDRRELDTGGSLAVSGSDSTPDCHAMGKFVHSPTVSLPPDPEEFVFMTTTGFAVRYAIGHVPIRYA